MFRFRVRRKVQEINMAGTSVAEKPMTMPQVRAKAKDMGITPGKMKKAELICAIQVAEGNTPCYGTSNGECPYTDCCFRVDCLKTKW